VLLASAAYFISLVLFVLDLDQSAKLPVKNTGNGGDSKGLMFFTNTL
jgi:hypothetical protein